MSQPTEWTASEALREIGAGRLSPREYAEALLAQCEAANGLNAFIHLDPQQVLDAAGRAAPGTGGRLSGLPVPVKDNFDTADMPTTGGTPDLSDHRPARNAPVVQRLIDEGAFVMGKLNMHELAYGITSNNGAFGPVRNPYDPSRIPGGSSGGSGAAVGARMAPVALGSDTGGSVRIPAALCGVAGLRPTTGRYSQAGIVPISNTRDTAGPLARSVEDLALFDSVIVGAAGDLPAMSLKGARIGVPRGHYFENLHPETARVAEEVLAALAAAGAVLVEADMPELPKLDEAAGFPIALYETVVELNRYLSEHNLPLDFAGLAHAAASPDVADLLQSLLTEEGAIPEPVYRKAMTQTRPALQAGYADYFTSNDVLAAIFPTTPLPAAPIGDDETVELNGEQVPTFPTFIRNSAPSSLAGIPGVTLPAGLSADGLPIGMELDGPAGSDRALLALCAAVEAILPATPAPPSMLAGQADDRNHQQGVNPMPITFKPISRRRFVAGALGSGAAVAAPAVLTGARAAGELKMATFYALSGPGSLFGPTQTAVTKLAVDEINAGGGIGGRKVIVVPSDGGAPPAEAAKSAIRLMLRDKVDIVVGSHDSAVREAIVAALKGRVPYVYTPLYEGGECNPNVYVTADTPQQQVQPSITWLAKTLGAKSYYLIGNDYVWPRKTNEQAKKYIAAAGGKVVGEEYVPLGAPNKFEDAVTRIKAKKPDLVVITLVGGDNINFNRTFAGFGLDKSIKRISYLLEEQTLLGIGDKSSSGLYSAMSYFENEKSAANAKFKAGYRKAAGAKAPQLGMIGVDTYGGVNCAKALIEKAGGTDAAKLMAAANNLEYRTPTGTGVMTNRHVVKDMFLAECKGTSFEIVQTFKAVAHGQTCS